VNDYKKKILIDLDGVLNEYGKEKYDKVIKFKEIIKTLNFFTNRAFL